TSVQSRTLCVNIGATPSRTVGRRPRSDAAGGRKGSKDTTAVHEGTAVKNSESLESSPFPYAGLNQFRFDGCVLRPACLVWATPNGQPRRMLRVIGTRNPGEPPGCGRVRACSHSCFPYCL